MVLRLLCVFIFLVVQDQIFDDRGATSELSIVLVDDLPRWVVLLPAQVLGVVLRLSAKLFEGFHLILLPLLLFSLSVRLVVDFMDIFDLFQESRL